MRHQSPVQAAGFRLLELHCGFGHSTVALAPLFQRVLAVELNRRLAQAAEHNLSINGVSPAPCPGPGTSPSHLRLALRRARPSDAGFILQIRNVTVLRMSTAEAAATMLSDDAEFLADWRATKQTQPCSAPSHCAGAVEPGPGPGPDAPPFFTPVRRTIYPWTATTNSLPPRLFFCRSVFTANTVFRRPSLCADVISIRSATADVGADRRAARGPATLGAGRTHALASALLPPHTLHLLRPALAARQSGWSDDRTASAHRWEGRA
eukprot:COSAG01_NODE_7938_length_2984_cov_1.493588_2_plen_265_part_00